MREEYYVDIRNKEERQKFIEELESNGYIIDNTIFSREDIICKVFPIIVDKNNKKISTMGNTTTAAGAASCGLLISKEECLKMIL